MGPGALAATGVALDFANTAYANRMQTRAAHEAQDFSAQQYATRYQTQVADLKKAGLNPMLAYMQSPGSAPSGVMAQQQKPQSADAVLASAQAIKIKEEAENIRTERKNIEELNNKIKHETYQIRAQVDEIDQRIATGKAQQKDYEQSAELKKRQQFLTAMQAELALQQKNINIPEELAAGTTSAVTAAHVSRTVRPVVDILDKILGGRQKYYNAIKP